jgi:urease accessory protein
LAELRQSGCLKARFPRGDGGGWFELVTLNISGGVAGGDRLQSEIAVGDGARATIAGQAAERFYRALPQATPARLRTTVTVADGGAAEWLPQLSILFDGCALDRTLCVELAEDARFVGVESLVFGRAAMGEVVGSGWVRDVIRIRRGGRLLLHDAIRLEGAVAAQLARPAVAGGARAVATLILVAPDAGAFLDGVRAALDAGGQSVMSAPYATPSPNPLPRRGGEGSFAPSPRLRGEGRGEGRAAPAIATVEAGVSAWDGVLLARILAPDGAALRAAVVAGLQAIRGGRMLPRVWLC